MCHLYPVYNTVHIQWYMDIYGYVGLMLAVLKPGTFFLCRLTSIILIKMVPNLSVSGYVPVFTLQVYNIGHTERGPGMCLVCSPSER